MPKYICQIKLNYSTKIASARKMLLVSQFL